MPEVGTAPVHEPLAAAGATRRHEAASGRLEVHDLAVEPHPQVADGLRPIAQRCPVHVGSTAVKLDDHLAGHLLVVADDAKVRDRDPRSVAGR